MRFLLDTNAVISILNSPRGPVATRLRHHATDAVGTSSIVQHELYFGAFNSARRDLNLQRLGLLRLPVLDFGAEDAREAGRIRALLEKRGRPIGAYDVLIAGQALARGCVVVTANAREFARVPDLLHENWSVS
jgi:tRNA(fMet)-specific endonuclease VapC